MFNGTFMQNDLSLLVPESAKAKDKKKNCSFQTMSQVETVIVVA